MADFNPSMLNAQDQMITVDDQSVDPNALTQSAAPWMTSVQMPPLASNATKNAIMRGGQAITPTNAGAAPWAGQQANMQSSGDAGAQPWDQGVVMPDEDMSAAPFQRTDFTQ